LKNSPKKVKLFAKICTENFGVPVSNGLYGKIKENAVFKLLWILNDLLH